MFRWLKRLVRRHTNPIDEDRAQKSLNRLSLIYMLVAWNALGFVGYMVYTGRGDWAQYYGYKSEEESKMSPAQQWTKTLGIKDATVYRVKGLKMEKYEVHNDFTRESEEAEQ